MIDLLWTIFAALVIGVYFLLILLVFGAIGRNR